MSTFQFPDSEAGAAFQCFLTQACSRGFPDHEPYDPLDPAHFRQWFREVKTHVVEENRKKLDLKFVQQLFDYLDTIGYVVYMIATKTRHQLIVYPEQSVDYDLYSDIQPLNQFRSAIDLLNYRTGNLHAYIDGEYDGIRDAYRSLPDTLKLRYKDFLDCGNLSEEYLADPEYKEWERPGCQNRLELFGMQAGIDRTLLPWYPAVHAIAEMAERGTDYHELIGDVTYVITEIQKDNRPLFCTLIGEVYKLIDEQIFTDPYVSEEDE